MRVSMSRFPKVLACVLAMLTTSSLSLAQSRASDSEQAERKLHLLEQKRLLRKFDFEEFKENNLENFPEDWYPIGRPPRSPDPNFMDHALHRQMARRDGFPAYAFVRFDPPQIQTNVNHAFYLGLNGGSAGAYLAVGALPAVPSSDYLIHARVKTSPLQAAYAQLIVYFLDISGRIIEPSVRRSEHIRSPDQWKQVSLKLWGEYPNAAWIGMQIELRQPEANPESPLGRHQIVLQEINGAAWFDDIDIWQIPFVTVSTQSTVNIIRTPERPRLRMHVRDVTGGRLESTVELYDHHQRVVARNHQRVGGGEPSIWQWTPPLERYGWYVLDMKVFDRGGKNHDSPYRSPVARSVGAFLWLGDDTLAHSTDAKRFGFSAENLPERQFPLLPDILKVSGVGSVLLSAWDAHTDLEHFQNRESLLDNVMRQLSGPAHRVAISFHPLPRALEHDLAIYPNDVLTMFDRPWSRRAAYLAPILTQYGQQVRWWKLGRIDSIQPFFDPQLPSRLATIKRELSTLTPSPRLVLPWRITQSRRSDVTDDHEYAINVPPFVLPQQIPDYMADWRQPPLATVSLKLAIPSARQLNQPARITDLILRMLYAWKSHPDSILIERPWAASSDRQLTLLPDPLLGVFINTAARLSGRRVLHEMSFSRGTHAMILDGPAGPALAAWNTDADPENAVIQLQLGGEPVAVDEWGNRSPVPLINNQHQLRLTRTPVFIENIDAQLAAFRASFRLDDPFIESRQIPHNRVLSFTNTWPVAITGRFVVTGPKRWRFSTTRHDFTLRPGETMRIPVELGFPISEIAGHKSLQAVFDFTTDRNYHIQLHTPMELGLRGVDFKSDLTLQPGTQPGTVDAVVTMRIANVGDQPLLAYAFAALTGYPRQEKVLPRLEPGRSVVRSFRFDNAADALKTNRIRIGLREADGSAVLNHVHTPKR